MLYDYNIYYNGTTPNILGPHDLVTNPEFVNPDTGPTRADFQLRPGSPAIDSGTSTRAPGTNIVGTPRPQGAGYDRGAYELKSGGTVPFSTSFESSNLQPTWNNTVDATAYPAGNSVNVGGVCCNIAGPETKVLGDAGHTGSHSLMYSGNDTSNNTSYAYTKVFDLSNRTITVGSNTTLSY